MAKKKQKEVQVIENPIHIAEEANQKRMEVIRDLQELRSKFEQMAERIAKTDMKEYGTNRKRKDEMVLKSLGKVLEVNNSIISACNAAVSAQALILEQIRLEVESMKRDMEMLEGN